jgi:putative ABC transport system ATP-binding protein
METDLIARIENVEKVYGGNQPYQALNGVNLLVNRGDFAVLVGPSGAGKSTLLNILGALDRPTNGRVEIAGVDVSTLSDDALSKLRLKNLGFIFQSFNLVEVLTVFENVQYPLSISNVPGPQAKERVEWLLEHVGLSEHRHKRVTDLSGGQRQRVAIARALANKPTLVLADEPTAALDSKTGESILALMKRMNEEDKATFLIATHDPRVMAHARRVIKIEDGRVYEELRGLDVTA